MAHAHARGLMMDLSLIHILALLVHVVDGLVVLRRVLDATHGLVLERIERLAPVSYTHLDVYKRQVLPDSTVQGISSSNSHVRADPLSRAACGSGKQVCL